LKTASAETPLRLACSGIGKSAYRGHEVIYPQPFGVITTASEKTYPVDYSHFNIMGTAVVAHGIEADRDRACVPGWDRLGPARGSQRRAE